MISAESFPALVSLRERIGARVLLGRARVRSQPRCYFDGAAHSAGESLARTIDPITFRGCAQPLPPLVTETAPRTAAVAVPTDSFVHRRPRLSRPKMKIVRSARKKRRSFPFRSIMNAAEAVCTCDACRGRLTTIRLAPRGGRASPSSIATTALSPAVHGPARIVVVINDEGVEQAFGLRNFRVSGMSPADGYATEDDLSCAILSALSRPLPASAINYFLRLHQFTRS